MYLRTVLAIKKYTEVSRISLFLNYLAIIISLIMPSSRTQLLSTIKNNVSKRNDTLQTISTLRWNEVISDRMRDIIRGITSQNKETLIALVDGIKDATHQLSLMQHAIESEVVIRSSNTELARLDRRRDITQARMRREREETATTDLPPTYEQAMAGQDQATQEERVMAGQEQATQEEWAMAGQEQATQEAQLL